jgi:hypothetical protein
MPIYRTFLRVSGELVDRSINAVCNSDREAHELAQRMLDDEGCKEGRAEVWAGSRFAGVVTLIPWLLGS